jgi:hypothetical protein
MTVGWQSPLFNGGFSIRSFKLWVDNALLIEQDPTLNFYQLTGLTLGQTLKLQVSAVNQVGESILSTSNTVIFANKPSAPATL